LEAEVELPSTDTKSENRKLFHPGFKHADLNLDRIKLVEYTNSAVYHMIKSRHCGHPNKINPIVKEEFLDKLKPLTKKLLHELL
jgi:hypothetical protein